MNKLIFTKTYTSEVYLSLKNDIMNDVNIRNINEIAIGDIYLGRVVSIVEEINSAFVSLGNSKIGFIRCKDLLTQKEKMGLQAKNIKVKDVKINNLISEGQDLLVQVVREANASKNPMLVTELSLSNKYLAILVEPKKILFSKKIRNPYDKKRLKNMIKNMKVKPKYSIIFRRQSLEVEEDKLMESYSALEKQLDDIVAKSAYSIAPKKMFDAKNFILEILESRANGKIDKIYVDNKKSKKIVTDYFDEYISEYDTPEIIDDYDDLVNMFSVVDYLESLSENQINLENGGNICIERTEAMTVIDVNSTDFDFKENTDIVKRETAWYINLEALKEIKRQLLMRNIGGIIIVDLINFRIPENEEQFLILARRMFRDTKVRVEGFTKLGLLELTRKRTVTSTVDRLFTNCRVCGGSGKVASEALIKLKLENNIHTAKLNRSSDIVDVSVSQNELDYILDVMSEYIESMEKQHNIRINLITS